MDRSKSNLCRWDEGGERRGGQGWGGRRKGGKDGKQGGRERGGRGGERERGAKTGYERAFCFAPGLPSARSLYFIFSCVLP